MAGTLYVVATPIGNLEDISFRALRVLRECDLVAAEDTRRTDKLLKANGLVTKVVSYHHHNRRSRLPLLVQSLESGLSIALVSDAGTPGISDPGLELIRACVEKGISVDPIPGASAPVTALLVSGFEPEPFTFFGFSPNKSGQKRKWLERAFSVTNTFCFFEAPHRIKETLQMAAEISVNRPMMLAREMTKVHQEFIRGTAIDIMHRLNRPIGEMTVVVSNIELTEIHRDASDEEVYACFVDKLRSAGNNRRQALELVASELGCSRNEVYAAVERAKKGSAEPGF